MSYDSFINCSYLNFTYTLYKKMYIYNDAGAEMALPKHRSYVMMDYILLHSCLTGIPRFIEIKWR